MKSLSIFISNPSDFLTDHRVHGDGNVAFQFINRLAERGHRLSVAYAAADLAKPLHPNISLHKINCNWPSSRLQTLEYMLRVRSLFWKLHKQSPFDVIHQLNPVLPGLTALLAGNGIPLVLGIIVPGWPSDAEPAPTHWRGVVGKALIQPWIDRASKWQQSQASAFILGNPAADETLYDPERFRSRITIVPVGLDIEKYSPAPIRNPPGKTILYVGSLEHRKGIFVLAEAFRIIWRVCPEARLLIVGKGSQREALERIVLEDDSKIAVEFLGGVDEETKVKMLQSADVVTMPSLGEPHGMVAVEAMACETPTVGTRAGGLQHLIPENGGRLVPPKDPQSLAKALIELLENPPLRAEMGRYGRQFVIENFAWEVVISRLENVYRSVVNK